MKTKQGNEEKRRKKKRRDRERRQERLLKFPEKLVLRSGLPPNRLGLAQSDGTLVRRNLANEFHSLGEDTESENSQDPSTVPTPSVFGSVPPNPAVPVLAVPAPAGVHIQSAASQ